METHNSKKRIISIAGLLGSGKSSTAKVLAPILCMKHFSSGDFMRAIADERGISLGALTVVANTDKSIDDVIDEQVKKTGEGDNLVIDSRLAFHWIPDSFKVFLSLDPEVAAQRVFDDAQKNYARHKEHLAPVTSPKDVKKSIIARLESEKQRYWNKYGVNHVDPKNFDLVIDTEFTPLDQVVAKILEEYQKWINS